MTERTIDDTLEGYLEGMDPQEVQIVPWPTRPTRKVGLRPLADDELRESDARSRKWATETGIPHVAQARSGELFGAKPWTVRDDHEFADLYLAEVVARALVHPETHQPLCPNGALDFVGRRIRRETIQQLGKALADFTEKTAPVQPQIGSPEEFDRILAVLGEEQGATVLEACGPAMLRALLLYTVAQHAKSTGSTSSTTTPVSASGEPPPG